LLGSKRDYFAVLCLFKALHAGKFPIPLFWAAWVDDPAESLRAARGPMLRRAASAFVRSPAPSLWPGGLKIACPEERATTIASPSRPIGETFCPTAGWVGRNGTRGAGGIEWHGMLRRSERKSTNKQHSTICFLRKRLFVINAEKHNPAIRRRSPRRRSSRSLSRAAPPFCQSEPRSAARPLTKSCGFEVSEPIPFPGADSIFSSRCGAISGRLRFVVRSSCAAIPATETPRFKGSRSARPSPRDAGVGTNIERLRNFGKKFGSVKFGSVSKRSGS
jgi:hypothetical protein